MTQTQYIVTCNEQIASGIWSMRLRGNTAAITAAGQFVNLQLPGLFLRRPISVCDWSEDEMRIVYKVVGEGTRYMSRIEVGASMNVLTGLGNGYDIRPCGDSPLLIGGGVGVPPLLGLAKRLRMSGKAPQVLLGFNSDKDVILADEFTRLGCTVQVATMDGSCGIRGLVTDVIPNHYSYYYTCGPLPMLRALLAQMTQDGQLSLEARMGCGFGVCMGCTIQTQYGPQRVCKEGPVFRNTELTTDI